MPRGLRLNHVSVFARDLRESERFYVELFGMEVVPAPRFGGLSVSWLRAGDTQLHLFERPAGVPVQGHFAITVDDIVGVAREAERRGVLDYSFGYPMALLPGGEAQVYLRDPAGNLVEADHPDGAAAHAELPEMIVLAERVEQPDGPVPRLLER